MKLTVTIARVLAGALFIFSGLVKAIDPRGLSYKMQEFFEAWASDGFMKPLMESLNHYALTFSIIMITLEVAVGLALIIGWKKKITTWLLLLLILFFTFLTAYVLFSGKIRACGCFGDCIPLTPEQTFSKDIILLLMSLLLLWKVKYITPLAKPFFSFIYILGATCFTLLLQSYVLKHLPLVDCLPFKKGNNIIELRKMPADAVQDEYNYVFIYEKDGVKKEFEVSALPDSTWKFSDRKQILVKKGTNNIPLINDFSLSDSEGLDVTETVLSNPDEYYMLFLKDMPTNIHKWISDFQMICSKATVKINKVYIITARRDIADSFLSQNNLTVDAVLTCDATAFKTAARANPVLYKMKGPVIQGKWGWPDFDKVQ